LAQHWFDSVRKFGSNYAVAALSASPGENYITVAKKAIVVLKNAYRTQDEVCVQTLILLIDKIGSSIMQSYILGIDPDLVNIEESDVVAIDT